MNRPRIALLAVVLALGGTVTLQTLQSNQAVEGMAAAAGDFLASLPRGATGGRDLRVRLG